MESFIRGIPKAELHLHIEGTLEPELMFSLAQRNGVRLRFGSVDDLRSAYEFDDLQSFLDIYYEGAAVLRTVDDFADLMWAYLRRADADGVRHAEIFFDPQTHLDRGIGFGIFMGGFAAARARAANELGMSTLLIMCFLRHLSETAALATLEAAAPWVGDIVGVGLDSSEAGNPPERFERVYAEARAAGLRRVAHAGEEGPPAYITSAIDVLGAERIDHGVTCEQDDVLVERLDREEIPLTLCPLSNVKLRVFERIEDLGVKRLLDRGVRVCINSDDPAYFGGYVGENYLAVAVGLDVDRADIARLARNSLQASFLDRGPKEALIAQLDAFTDAA